MKQSYGIAKQVKLLEAIDQKLNALLEAQMGKDKAGKLIEEYDMPVNPHRVNVKSKDAVGALPVEQQAELAAQAEARRTNGGQQEPEAKPGKKAKPAE